MLDLKRIYAAPTEAIALTEPDSFEEKWKTKYPKIASHREIIGLIYQHISNIRKKSEG